MWILSKAVPTFWTLFDDLISLSFSSHVIYLLKTNRFLKIIFGGEKEMLKKILIWTVIASFLMGTTFPVYATTLIPKVKSKLLSEAEMSMVVGSGGNDSKDDGGEPQAKQSNIDWWYFVLDPGHGGSDSGAVGPTGLTEKSVNLAVAQILRDKLSTHNYVRVWLTRNGDVNVSLAERPKLAIKNNVDRFISIHHNSSSNSSSNYTVVYVHPQAGNVSRDMAQKVVDQLASQLGLSKGATSSGVATGNYQVLRDLLGSGIPAILTEASFISNPSEESRLRTSNYRSREADAIYQGILNHSKDYGYRARD